MKVAKNLGELRAHYRRVSKGWSEDTIWSAEALMFVAEKLDAMKNAPPQSERRVGVVIGGVFVGVVW